MATYYVNINNAYVTEGDGTAGSQFNYDQFLAALGTVGSHTFLLKGDRLGPDDNDVVLTFFGTHIIDAQLVTEPYRLRAYPGIGGGIWLDNTDGDIDMSNGILLSDLVSPASNLLGMDSGVGHNVSLYNIYSYATQGHEIIGETLDVKGSSFICQDGTFNFIANISVAEVTEASEFVDSLVAAVNGTISFSDSGGTGLLHILSNSALTSQVVDATAGRFEKSNLQVGWVPGAFPTTSLNATDFNEQGIAKDGSANDITALASGIFAGYEKGLFGGLNRSVTNGIGAFTFPLVTILPTTQSNALDKLAEAMARKLSNGPKNARPTRLR